VRYSVGTDVACFYISHAGMLKVLDNIVNGVSLFPYVITGTTIIPYCNVCGQAYSIAFNYERYCEFMIPVRYRYYY
jgi:hypothetical protein